MALTARTRLGPYEILGLIGAGGMGEVYRAHDTRLKRDVAIKVLHAAVLGDAERRGRFQREAELLASLNHPHIAQIYGLEQCGDTTSLVMELVEGETLADRLKQGALPFSSAVAIALQVATALEAAHDGGIIHRDVKPANIKITPDSNVKVLDFGLAKGSEHGATADAFDSPTVTANLTRSGVILGTAAYMSPEQARGSRVDRRADIWAFGCILYEMLSGRMAFGRGTITDTLVAVVDAEPDWSALPPRTPLALRRLLHRCLEKDAKHRLRDIGEARVELEGLQTRSPGWPFRRRTTIIVALGALIVASVAVTLIWRQGPKPVTLSSEYIQLTNFEQSAVAPSLSPDGRMVAFKVGEDFFLGSGQIYVKMLPAGESVRLTSSPAPKYGPVFTPDGSRVAFTQLTGKPGGVSWDTWIVPVLGGEPTRLLPNASGLTWIGEHQILFAEIKTGLHMGIVTATDSRAQWRAIYFPRNQGAMAHYAYASPDRQQVLVVEMDQSHAFTSPCRLVPFDGRSAGIRVGPEGTCTSAAWSPDGKWMYFGASVNGNSHLWRQKFPNGKPEQITFGPTEEEGVAVAPDGRSIVTSLGIRQSAIWLRDAAGERAITTEGYAFAPRLSTDGRRVFYLAKPDAASGATNLRVVDVASGRSEVVLPGVSVLDYDVSADETLIAFTTATQAGERQLWVGRLDRGAPPRLVARNGDQVSFATADQLVFRELGESGNALIRINIDGSGRERLDAPPVMDKGDVSPDGRWVIVHSPGSEDGVRLGTYAVPLGKGSVRRVCFPVFCTAEWAANGAFFYVAVNPNPATTFATDTLALAVPAGSSLPELPAEGLDLSKSLPLEGASLIARGLISPGADPSVYLFTKSEIRRNLYRIPLH